MIHRGRTLCTGMFEEGIKLRRYPLRNAAQSKKSEKEKKSRNGEKERKKKNNTSSFLVVIWMWMWIPRYRDASVGAANANTNARIPTPAVSGIQRRVSVLCLRETSFLAVVDDPRYQNNEALKSMRHYLLYPSSFFLFLSLLIFEIEFTRAKIAPQRL